MSSMLLPSGHTRIEHVELRAISKKFPGVIANDQVNFDVRAGEIHALLGENGAGKSTLMKILYGLYQPDAGELRIDGQIARFTSPADALARGIGMIHQHFMLVQTLTVTENVALGMTPKRGERRMRMGAIRARLLELSSIYGLKIDPDAYIWQLSVGEQQRVEIVKALFRGGALLIMDEPTAVLTPQEVDELFSTLKTMRVQGHALIFISHKLGEVQALSDRITVMRGGRTIETVPNQHVEKRTLARMMVGRDVQFAPDRPPNATGAVRLAIHDLHVLNDQRLPALRGVSLEVCGGEIVGIAGVSGNGQRELAESIAGLRPAERGALMLNGVDMLNAPIAARLRAGLAYIPEERMRHGMIGAFSVAENAVLQNHADSPYTRRGLLDFNAISAHAQKLIEQYQIKTPSTRTPVKNLSGGNIQKLILGRELARQPNIVIAAQPTRGVDISATEYIHNVLMGQRGAGVAILLISEDLDEILALSDRIAVIYEGRIVRIFSRAEATPERLGMLMAGAATTRD